jgi:hypothetical protein
MSVVWNSTASSGTENLERIQQRSQALWFNCPLFQVHWCYSLDLEQLKLRTLRMSRHRINIIFLIQVYFASKFCPSVLEILVLEFLFGVSDSTLCLTPPSQAKTDPLLDAYQLLMFAEILYMYACIYMYLCTIITIATCKYTQYVRSYAYMYLCTIITIILIYYCNCIIA